MNFSVYNTEILNNPPESGIYPTYRSMANGITLPLSTQSNTLEVDDNFIYMPMQLHSYISKRVENLCVLDLNGNILSKASPNLPLAPKVLCTDENFIYVLVEGFRATINGDSQGKNVYRFNKNTLKIDNNFCIGSIFGWDAFWMRQYNNKYYILSASTRNFNERQIYPNLNQNSTAGLFIIKDKRNVLDGGRIQGSINRIKIKDNDIYFGGRTTHLNFTLDYPKLLKVNKNNVIDTNFYPIIERLNNTAGTPPSATSSDVFDFDFDNEGIYIGGNFLTVGGEQRIGVAKIDYSGNLINNFNANISGSNNVSLVRGILTTGSGVFVCLGGAGAVGGSPFKDGSSLNSQIIKLNNDGSLNASFTGNSGIFGSNICLAISGDFLYIGGGTASAIVPNVNTGLARINTENGIADSNFRVSIQNNINRILVSGDSLYIAGANFNPYRAITGGISNDHFATGVVKLNATNGIPDTGFKIDFRGSSAPTINDMVIKGNELHIVGSFTGIEGREINGYAVVDTISGKLIDTGNYFIYNINCRAIAYDSNQNRAALSSDATNLCYITGYDFNYDSKINVFDNNFNILNNIQFTGAGNGSLIAGFPSRGSAMIAPNVFTSNDSPFIFNGTTGYISSGYINNPFFFVRSFNLENGNMLDTSNFYLSGNSLFLSAVNYNNDYYFGGDFTSIGANNFTGARSGIVKTNINGNVDLSFNLPINVQGVAGGGVQNLKVIDNNLYIMGNFTGFSGVRLNGFLRYNLLTQTADTGFSNFVNRSPVGLRNVHNDSLNNLYFTFPSNSSLEYTGANYFENSGNLFKFNSGSYTPDLNFSSKYFFLTNDILIENDKIYAPLRNTNKISGSNIYKINKRTRQISDSRVSIIAPLGAETNSINDIHEMSTGLYVCGSFTGINGIAKTGACKLNKNDLSLDINFNLNFPSGTPPNRIIETTNHLYFLGPFTSVNDNAITGICRINKTNDLLDTSYVVNHSGMAVATTIPDLRSGNLYYYTATTPNYRVLDLNAGTFTFTGSAGAPTSNPISIVAAPNNLIFSSNTFSTISDPRYIGGRSRALFAGSYSSGPSFPYSVWTQTNVMSLTRPQYIPQNNSIFYHSSNQAALFNNKSSRTNATYHFFNADKLHIANKRMINWATNFPITNNSFVYVKNNEVYLLYVNFLLANSTDKRYYITNSSLTSIGVVKYDPIKERYDIII